MTNTLAVVDYGAGNMFSIVHALKSVGANPVLVRDRDEWDATKPNSAVLPGVGAFGHGAQSLTDRGLRERITSHASSGRPLLGICLGAQLLLDSSSEFGEHRGLGLVPGSALPFDNALVRVPHIGWARVSGSSFGDSPLLPNVPSGAWMYFVHSFHLAPADAADVLLTTKLGPIEFTSAIQRNTVYGVQFHPEKSGPLGLRILANFLQIGVDNA